MLTPLLTEAIARDDIAVVTAETLDPFLAENQTDVLFVAGDAERLGEVNDVAVILPELIKAFPGRMTPCVAARDSERAMQLRYRFNAFPALVFVRDGAYLGVIPRVLDWGDYLRQISEILAREPGPAPAFELPEGCYSAGAPH